MKRIIYITIVISSYFSESLRAEKIGVFGGWNVIDNPPQDDFKKWTLVATKDSRKIILWQSTHPLIILFKRPKENFLVLDDPLLPRLGNIIFIIRFGINDPDLIYQTPFSDSLSLYFDMKITNHDQKGLRFIFSMKEGGRGKNGTRMSDTIWTKEDVVNEKTTPISASRPNFNN